MTRTCPICGVEFDDAKEHGGRPKRYCSPRCRNLYNVRNYAKNHPERKRPAKKVAKRTRTCAVCGKEFVPACNRQRFCGKLCFHKAKYAKERDAIRIRRLKARENRECVVCGAVFTPKNNRGKYCSHKCANAARSRARPVVVKTCDACGAEFSPVNARQRFCSVRCRDRAKFRRPGVRASRPSRVEPAGPSLARVRAYLSLPPAERWAKRGTLTEAELKLASKKYEEAHSHRAVEWNWLPH